MPNLVKFGKSHCPGALSPEVGQTHLEGTWGDVDPPKRGARGSDPLGGTRSRGQGPPRDPQTQKPKIPKPQTPAKAHAGFGPTHGIDGIGNVGGIDSDATPAGCSVAEEG